jgi:5-methylcytosine-specific restriction endonuclease McrA
MILYIDDVSSSDKCKACGLPHPEGKFKHIKFREDNMTTGWHTNSDMLICQDCYNLLKNKMCGNA